jgi:putative two-component system response regulator
MTDRAESSLPGDVQRDIFLSQFAGERARSSVQSTVLIVDDDARARLLLRRMLDKSGFHTEEAGSGLAALLAITMRRPDMVLLDVKLPDMDGFEVCTRLKQDAATRLTPVVFITALNTRDDRIRGLEAGADEFLSKPVHQEELLTRIRSAVRLKHYTDDLDSVTSIISTLATMMETRGGVEGRCLRVANYATRLGRALTLSDQELQALYRGGFVHDLGMLAISDLILRRAGPLEPDEYELVKSHTLIGDRLCGNLGSLAAARPIVRSHHERLDGSGYPDGLSGDAVPLLAQIISLVDTFEALTVPRPYRASIPSHVAADVLRDHVHRGWRDAGLVETFISLVEHGTLNGRTRVMNLTL